MNDYSNKKLSTPQLRRIRTLLFGALAFVWFIEMALWGFQTFSKAWTSVWKMVPPDNPQLATALLITQAVHSPAKGALFVMAVFGLRSKDPSTRNVLFASMALVPPLNIAFQFRAQGFPVGSVVVATIFSSILWGSFFLLGEHSQKAEQSETEDSDRSPISRWEIFQYVWFAANSVILTITSFLFLFSPTTALNLVFPCLSALQDTSQGGISSLIHSGLTTGTHVFSLATASWIATIFCRKSPTLRQAMTVACTVHAGLFFLFPLRQIAMDFGGNCATSSILIAFVPLFIGWVLYAALSYRVEYKKRQEAYI